MARSKKNTHRTRRELDALAQGQTDGGQAGNGRLDDFVAELAAMNKSDGVAPNRSLTEFVSGPSHLNESAVDTADDSREKRPMIAQLSALAATTFGKVALTGGLAAATVGGAVVVNEVQQNDPVEIVTADHGDSTSSGSSSTASSTAPTSTAPTSTTPHSSDSTPSTSAAGSAPTSSLVPTTSGPGTAVPADTEPISIDADGAGTVVYQVVNGQLVLLSAVAEEGWILRDESTPLEIDLSFRTADDRFRVDVDIEIEDGAPRVRVEREDRLADGDDSIDDDSDDSDDDSDADDSDDSDDVDDDSDDDDIDDSDDDEADDSDESDEDDADEDDADSDEDD